MELYAIMTGGGMPRCDFRRVMGAHLVQDHMEFAGRVLPQHLIQEGGELLGAVALSRLRRHLARLHFKGSVPLHGAMPFAIVGVPCHLPLPHGPCGVLAVYQRPYDPRFPQVCLDEVSTQLLAHTRPPLPPAPGRTAREDYEYQRHGVANIFLCYEPLRGWRRVTVTERRTRIDWAQVIQRLVDVHYPEAKRIVLVMDNLNTHTIGSLYEAFPPAEARRLAEKLELHYTPKHGSWLNMAEIELSILRRQCLARRIPDQVTLTREAAAWEATRNGQGGTVTWRFTTADARIRLKHLYPIHAS